jgi:FMN-dependent NADH-azoreductase
MSNVLVLKSSVLLDASASNELVDQTVALIRSRNPSARVVFRDLAGDPIPHLTPDSAAVVRGAIPSNAAQETALTLANDLVEEVKRADTVVIGAPMYNFGIPSTLKSWFDHVMRAGVTFSYGEGGPEGLLKGKRAFVILSRGGLYSEGPAKPMDSQEPHVKTMLGFIGITDVTFIHAEKLGFGPEHRDQAMRSARFQIEEAVKQPVAQAA